jgi:predicted nucleic acid-binding protein
MPLDAAARIIVDLSTWPVHCPGVEDIPDAIQLQQRYKISFWDAMIVASAKQLDCQQIWSQDLNPGQAYDTATVVNPFQ